MSRWSCLYVLMGCMLCGCEPHILTPAEVSTVLAPDIQDGKTTRQQVVLKFGTPAAEFEQGRILTYRLEQDDAGKLWPCTRDLAPIDPNLAHRAPWSANAYSLVLVFNGKNILSEHSLVPMKRNVSGPTR